MPSIIATHSAGLIALSNPWVWQGTITWHASLDDALIPENQPVEISLLFLTGLNITGATIAFTTSGTGRTATLPANGAWDPAATYTVASHRNRSVTYTITGTGPVTGGLMRMRAEAEEFDLFTATGAAQSYTPAVSGVRVHLGGAGGGSGGRLAGFGGSVKGFLIGTPTVGVYVGAAGAGSGGGGTGGWNGGGAGGSGNGGYGSSGGGASDIRVGAYGLADRVVVAGGGGGTSGTTPGGVGGDSTGTDGTGATSGGAGGKGTSTAGGAGGSNGIYTGGAGALGTGGAGGRAANGVRMGGGGGGGGLYGGGGGGGGRYAMGSAGSGGGGSGLSTGVNATRISGYRSGDGLVTISW